LATTEATTDKQTIHIAGALEHFSTNTRFTVLLHRPARTAIEALVDRLDGQTLHRNRVGGCTVLPQSIASPLDRIGALPVPPGQLATVDRRVQSCRLFVDLAWPVPMARFPWDDAWADWL